MVASCIYSGIARLTSLLKPAQVNYKAVEADTKLTLSCLYYAVDCFTARLAMFYLCRPASYVSIGLLSQHLCTCELFKQLSL